LSYELLDELLHPCKRPKHNPVQTLLHSYIAACAGILF
jgi:hypothetical protein